MSLAEKGVGKGVQPFSPPQHTEAQSARSAPVGNIGNNMGSLRVAPGERDIRHSR
jgi:hypothetical protein